MLLNRIKKSDIETELSRYKEIMEQLKVLEAKKDNLKNALITSYFAKHEEYIGPDGIVLATYKAQIRAIFDSVEFRKKHPNLYKDYCNDKEIFVFLVK